MSARSCSKCGSVVGDEARFCGVCGTPLAGPATVPPSPPRPRRPVAVLPLAILGAGIVAVVAALVLVRTSQPPAGQALLGAPSPTPRPAGERWGPSLSAAASPTGTSALAGLAMPVGSPAPEALPAAPPPTPTPTPPIVAVFKTREAARFDVSPDEAELEVNGAAIGTADDWDDRGGGKLFEFDRPGTYYVRMALKGYRTTWVKIVVAKDASDKVAKVDTELAEDGDTKGDAGAKKKDEKGRKGKKDAAKGDED